MFLMPLQTLSLLISSVLFYLYTEKENTAEVKTKLSELLELLRE